MRALALLAAAGFALVSLTGCKKDAQDPAALASATDTPTEAVSAAAKALRKGDLLGAMNVSLPPAEMERMKADWIAARAATANDAADDARYAEMMAKLSASDAEQRLYDELEPVLAKYEAEMASQMPLMIGMGQGFMAQGIAANESLTPEQKKQATEAVAATAAWLQTVPWTDRDLLRQAIAKAVATARKLDLPTMEQVRALEFEKAMEKAGVAFTGVKEILALYGLSLDKLFDSVRPELVSQEEDAAVVRVHFKLFDTALWHDTQMRRDEGRWYGKDTIDQLAKAGSGLVE